MRPKRIRPALRTQGATPSWWWLPTRMGEGNDELGKVLIKSFIFAVTQLEQLPKTMLFYNGGATLTTEGSDSLEDLKSLEAQE